MRDIKIDEAWIAGAHDYVRQYMLGTIRTQQETLAQCHRDIVEVAVLLVRRYRQGGKLLLCGNGGNAATCEHIAGELVSALNHDVERPGLPALPLSQTSSTLTGHANDFDFSLIFERQVEAFGQPGDVLIGISTSGSSKNVAAAMRLAQRRGLHTVGLLGMDAGAVSEASDLRVRVPSRSTQFIQEAHMAIGHMLCAFVEESLYTEATMPRLAVPATEAG